MLKLSLRLLAMLKRDFLEVCEEIDKFSKEQIGRVSAILSRFGCRQHPTP